MEGRYARTGNILGQDIYGRISMSYDIHEYAQCTNWLFAAKYMSHYSVGSQSKAELQERTRKGQWDQMYATTI